MCGVRTPDLGLCCCGEIAEFRFEVSHPSDKNKDVARMGHPELIVTDRFEVGDHGQLAGTRLGGTTRIFTSTTQARMAATGSTRIAFSAGR